MFEEEILQKIIQAWAEDQSHPYRNRKEKPLPNIRDARVLLEKAFLASLKREEGRSITFSIALLSKADIAEEQQISGRKQVIMSFDHSFPFTVESITKLAPAFDPKTTSLIAAPVDDRKTEYEIWGAMFFGSTTDRFEEIPVGVDGLSLFRPDVLMVTAITTGSLIITRGNSQIGRFISGDFVKAIPSPFASKAMGSYVMDVIKDDDGFKEHQNLYWHIYRDTLDRLLAEVSVRGHGGTIIIVPSEKVEQCRSNFTSIYSFKGSLELESLLNRLLVSSKCHDTLFNVALNKKYSERINVLAQFACIDGALIASSRLEVISFGSRLAAPGWLGKTFVGPDGFGGGGEEFDISKLGTRHRSAIDFVGACAGSIGFVVSQDGPIRGFVRKNNETILCWPDCRVSMFV
jgi:hypothetical protein